MTILHIELKSITIKHLLFLFFSRLINSILLKTYFTPDEYWQSLEVSYQMVFGKGDLTWEWKENAYIRGYTHPLLFAALYKLLKVFDCDTVWLVANAPKVLQAFFAALCDLATFLLAQKYFGRRVGNWALFCQLTSWFCFYCLCRTYSNSLEATLTVLALYFWTPLWTGGTGTRNQEKWALLCAALCVAVRSSSATLWIFVGLRRLSSFTSLWDLLKYIFQDVLLIAGGVVGLSVLVDCYFYGKLTFTPWNFLKFNLIDGGSAVFGSHPWHWLISQGLPVVCGPWMPLVLLGAWWAGRQASSLASVVAWFIAIHSLSAHKEFRFLLPVLPLCNIYAGYAVAKLTAGADSKKDQPPGKAVQKDQKDQLELHTSQALQSVRKPHVGKLFVGFLAVLNVAAGLYFSTFHQRGPLLAVEALADEINSHKTGGDLQICFWMPCHSTPLYSHLHFPDVPLKFVTLDCTPRIDDATYVSEHHQFMNDAKAFTETHFCAKNNNHLPDYIVLYDSTYEKLKDNLKSTLKFEKVMNLFHTHFNGDLDDPEVRKEIFVLKKTPESRGCL